MGGERPLNSSDRLVTNESIRTRREFGRVRAIRSARTRPDSPMVTIHPIPLRGSGMIMKSGGAGHDPAAPGVDAGPPGATKTPCRPASVVTMDDRRIRWRPDPSRESPTGGPAHAGSPRATVPRPPSTRPKTPA
ncbi:hypothetical protein GCM10011610_09520 [Nocardia rhizosphaerihabitans]|uniref:Uncharacterized protein n=1 Tax=Nocardia rhizosphaerihabitans TaxID=1691570 RepID=A0ABQ2K588_9NOCA|nr:hypothetical protein GCM10011610_09520 [Nocardia rhizosphaerihabitans]